MKVFLSHVLEESTPSYGNRDKFGFTPNSIIKNGYGANTSSWTFTNNHLGTHLDTPNHFYEDGKKTEDYSARDFFFEKVFLVELVLESGTLIDVGDLETKNIPEDTELLIIKTHYEKFRSIEKYHNDNPGIHMNVASYLKGKHKNLKAIGFDFISLTSWNYRDHGKLSHKEFLGEPQSLLIVEDMHLKPLNEKSKIEWVIIAPLRTKDGNGSPVTIIAELNEKY